jgi:hypothetical protein
MSNYHDEHVEMEDDFDMDDPADAMADGHQEQEQGLRDSDSEDEDGRSVRMSISFFCILAPLQFELSLRN